MTKDEALKLALEALEDLGMKHYESTGEVLYKETFTAIKEALSGCQCPECRIKPHASDCAVHNEPAYPKGKCNCGAQPEQEPVAWLQIGLAPLHEGDVIARTTKPTKWNPEWWRFEPLYTTPPQRKPLTDEEIYDMYNEPRSDAEMLEFARAIEAAHGIKGEA